MHSVGLFEAKKRPSILQLNPVNLLIRNIHDRC